MVEIARLSGWPYLALVSTHILILPMSMRAGAISAAAARFQKNAGMTGMKWRQGWAHAAQHRKTPVPRMRRGDWAPFGGVRAWQGETSNPTWPRGPVIHRSRSPRACAAASPLFGIRLRSDSYGRGFGPGLPASVPGLQMPGFDARCSPPRRPSGNDSPYSRIQP